MLVEVKKSLATRSPELQLIKDWINAMDLETDKKPPTSRSQNYHSSAVAALVAVLSMETITPLLWVKTANVFLKQVQQYSSNQTSLTRS